MVDPVLLLLELIETGIVTAQLVIVELYLLRVSPVHLLVVCFPVRSPFQILFCRNLQGADGEILIRHNHYHNQSQQSIDALFVVFTTNYESSNTHFFVHF